MTRLDVQIAGHRVVLAGRLDDSFSHGELVARIPAGDVAIDTGGVTFVNSIGMREWLRLVRVLREHLGDLGLAGPDVAACERIGWSENFR